MKQCNAAEQTLDRDAAGYDRMIDWRKRLANEAPMFRWAFERVGARRVLDAACGTGRHAKMFHDWGLRVDGADVSAAMLAYSREQFGEPEGLRWVQRSFFDPPEAAAFDAIICIGNALAIVEDDAELARAIAALATGLRPGGGLFIQMLNLLRFDEGPIHWQKILRQVDGDGDRVLLKGIHRIGRKGFVEIADLRLSDGRVEPNFRGARLLGVTAEDLCEIVSDAGMTDIELFGDYQRSVFDPHQSADLLVFARKA